MPLDRYRSMRDFAATDEPSGTDDPEISEHERSGRPRFVVQEHHATALHWDFRLERGGVLVSWAVPKGIPPDPRVNHMAVHTEDHPLSYIDFEGDIPKGEYGGGKVILWDRGTYEEVKYDEREVMVVLDGGRVSGRYVLFKTDGRNWMMHRMDPAADPTRELIPAQPRPQRPDPVTRLPPGDGWVYEPTFGGVAVAVAVDGGRCTAFTREGANVTDDWPELRAFGRAVGALPVVLDGELVRPKPKERGTFMISDVLWLDGHATTPIAFEDRRALLEKLGFEGPTWKTVPLYEDGEVLLEAAKAQGLPGVIARRNGDA